MRADISLAGKHADLKFTVRYSGCSDNPVRIQELPAVFLSRKLGQLVFYDGPEPWQVGAGRHMCTLALCDMRKR